MEIPLAHFAQYLKDAERLDQEFPHLHQQEWLTQNVSWDDRTAYYEPMPLEITPAAGPFTDWWQRLARN